MVMENILNYLELLFESFTQESLIIMSVMIGVIVLLSVFVLLQDKQIKECCKTNNVLRNQLLVFGKRNNNLIEDNENMKQHINLLLENSEKQASEFVEIQKTVSRMGLFRNKKGQFEKINK